MGGADTFGDVRHVRQEDGADSYVDLKDEPL
jgi:hypothetical protein